MVRFKVFNVHIIRSVIIAKLTMKNSQKNPAICEYKIDTGSHCNLMPINMFKVFFPKMTVKDLN